MSFFQKFMEPKMLLNHGDGGSGDPGQEPGNDDPPETGDPGQEPGNDEGGDPELTADDLTLLKGAGIDPDAVKGLDKTALSKMLSALRNGAKFMGMVRESEKAEKEKDRARRAELANADLLDEEGKLNTKHIAALREEATRAGKLDALLESLVKHGHIGEKAAGVVNTTDLERAAIALEYLQPESVDIEAMVEAAIKKRGGTNKDDRAGAGKRNEPEETTAGILKKANEAIASRLFGDRERPGSNRST